MKVCSQVKKIMNRQDVWRSHYIIKFLINTEIHTQLTTYTVYQYIFIAF